MRTSISIPDGLWERALRASQTRSASAVVQLALQRLVDATPEDRRLSPPDELRTRAAATGRALRDAAVQSYERGYAEGITLAETLGYAEVLRLAQADFDLERWARLDLSRFYRVEPIDTQLADDEGADAARIARSRLNELGATLYRVAGINPLTLTGPGESPFADEYAAAQELDPDDFAHWEVLVENFLDVPDSPPEPGTFTIGLVHALRDVWGAGGSQPGGEEA